MRTDKPYRGRNRQLATYRQQIAAVRKKMQEVRADTEPQEVADYRKGPQAGGRTTATRDAKCRWH